MATNKKLPAHLTQYQHAIVAIDTVVFSMIKGELMVLLLKITRDVFKGKWAIPGGLILPQENLEQAVERHLLYKTGFKKPYIEQLYTFADVNRDPRGRVVSVAHLVLTADQDHKLVTGSEYGDIKWFKVNELPPLAYDHKDVIMTGLERLRAKLGYTNIAQHLLPPTFALSDLQSVYESVLSRKLDKRNFRKKILSLDIVEKTDKKIVGSFRPAELYRFKSKKSRIVEIL